MITLNARMERKVEQINLSRCQIRMVQVLPKTEFDAVLKRPMESREIFHRFEEKADFDVNRQAQNCLLLLNDSNEDGLLVDTQGYSYARYTCYAPSIRASVELEIRLAAMRCIERIVDFSKDGFGLVTFEEIEQECGFAVTRENGLLPVFNEVVYDNEWVEDFDVTEDGVTIEIDSAVLRYINQTPNEMNM